MNFLEDGLALTLATYRLTERDENSLVHHNGWQNLQEEEGEGPKGYTGIVLVFDPHPHRPRRLIVYNLPFHKSKGRGVYFGKAH